MKNKKLRSILALSLAATMMLAACGTKTPETKTPETKTSEAKTPEPENSENGDEPITLTILTGMDEATYKPKESGYTKYLEEKFNVVLDFQYVPGGDFATYYNLMLESHDYPDIISIGLSTAQVRAGAETGALLPLNDYIEAGSNYQDILNENPGFEDSLTANDGNIYTFMVRSQAKHQDAMNKMYYRAEWLEALGWDHEPATTEEFKEFLIQIRDNDVNGNGDPNDEIPLMSYAATNGNDSPMAFLISPFELYPYANGGPSYYYITDDRDIYFTGNTDGYRKGLAYMADLYAEGLIAEECFVQDQDTFKSYLNKTGEEALVGCFPSWWSGVQIDSNVQSWFTYEALPPIMGDYQQTAARAGGSNLDLNSAITTACKHPEKAFEIYDWMLSEEAAWIYFYGLEGEQYEWVDAENFNGTSPAVKLLGKEEAGEFHWISGSYPRYETAEERYSVIRDESVYEIDNTWNLLKAAEKYEPYHVSMNFPWLVWADDDTANAFNEYKSLINPYINTASTEFIMGIRDINDDAQWQDYLDELEAMGLSEYKDVLRAYYGLD